MASEVDIRKQELEKAYDALQEFAGREGTFRSDLESSLQERLGFNKDLIEQRNKYASAREMLPSQLRQEYAGSAILNPLSQEAIIENRRSTLGQQLGNVSDLLTQRGQLVSDLLNRGVSQYQQQLTARDLAVQRAREFLQLAMEEEASRRAAAAAAGNDMSWLQNALAGGGGDGEELAIETSDGGVLGSSGGDVLEGASALLSPQYLSSHLGYLEKLSKSPKLSDRIAAEIARKYANAQQQVRLSQEQWKGGDKLKAVGSFLKSYWPF